MFFLSNTDFPQNLTVVGGYILLSQRYMLSAQMTVLCLGENTKCTQPVQYVVVTDMSQRIPLLQYGASLIYQLSQDCKECLGIQTSHRFCSPMLPSCIQNQTMHVFMTYSDHWHGGDSTVIMEYLRVIQGVYHYRFAQME